MASFFEKLKEVSSRTNLSEKEGTDPMTPNMKYGRNAGWWRHRQVVPFSFRANEKGDRQYGYMVVPEYERGRFNKNGGTYDKEIESYGGELIDGMSYNTKGLNDLLSKAKEWDLQIYGDEMVEMDDAPKFKNLLGSLRSRQNAKASEPTFYQNYRNSVGGGLGL